MRNISLAFFVVPSFSLSLTAILVSSQLMHLSYLVERRERMRMMRGRGGGKEEEEHLFMANSHPLTPSLLISSPSTSFSSL